MKIYCHTTTIQDVEGGEYRRYISGNSYELDPNEDFFSGDSMVFIYTDEKFGKKKGCRFTLQSVKVGNCDVFSHYFLNFKEYRKLKLEKLQEKINKCLI